MTKAELRIFWANSPEGEIQYFVPRANRWAHGFLYDGRRDANNDFLSPVKICGGTGDEMMVPIEHIRSPQD
jgi:hypothetical protein